MADRQCLRCELQDAVPERLTVRTRNFREVINDFEGPNIVGHYFSVTEKESKRGEFDYMTMAVISSGRLLVKCYFLSSDGAPDFGADAMQMMRSIKYIAPPPEAEKK